MPFILPCIPRDLLVHQDPSFRIIEICFSPVTRVLGGVCHRFEQQMDAIKGVRVLHRRRAVRVSRTLIGRPIVERADLHSDRPRV